jgi:iron complex outermembrane receptor protein
VRTTVRRTTSSPRQEDTFHSLDLLIFLASLAAFPGAASAADLTDMSLEDLMKVSVVGASKYDQQQRAVPAAVSVITREEIQAFGWRTLNQALASLPGVYTTYDRQSVYLGVRGFGLPGDYNTRVLITINGNRLNDPTFDDGLFGRQFPVDMDLIERIEFIPGPGGAVYGQNAMFAVVNIVTRTGAEVHGAEVSVDGQEPQSLIEGRASVGGRLDNGVDVLMSVTDMNAKGQNLFFNYGASGISGVAAGLDGDRSQQFFGRIAAGPWSWELVYGLDRKNDPTGSYFSDPLVPGQYLQVRDTLTQLQYQDNFAGDSLHVSARLFTGSAPSLTQASYGTMYSYPVASDWVGMEARIVSTALAAHTLMLGLEGQDNYRENLAQIDFANPAGTMYLPNTGHRAGVYGQDEWRLSDALAATLGLRADNNDETGTALSPRAALVWQATPATTAKFLYGTAHRAPNAFEASTDFQPGAVPPSLVGETVDTLEFDVDHRVGRDLTLRASVYQWTLHDLIVLNSTPVDGYTEYQNIQPVETRGLELSSDKTWDWGARLRDSVSIQHAAYSDGGEVVNSPKVLAKLNFSSRLPLDGLRVGYELRYDGPRLTLDGTTLGGYAVSNLYLGTEALAKGLDLSLVLENFCDKRYAQPGSANNWQNSLGQDGRSVLMKATYAF